MRKFLRVPKEFAKAILPLKDCFIRHAILQGLSAGEGGRQFGLLPEAIASAICFQDSFTDIWRYDLGTPSIKLAGGQEIIGTLQFQEVGNLVSVMRLATQILDQKKLQQYLNRLANVKKHPDVIAEFQPLLHRTSLAGIENEARGANKKTIDWLIPDEGQPPIFIEVKSRIKDLIESLESMEFAQSLGIEEIPAPHHDPAVMLRSTVEKFAVKSPIERIHCIWIAAHLKQETSETRSAFDQLEAGRIHVVVFGGWTREASIIGTAPELIQSVAARLNLTPGEQFFFRRG